MKPGELTTSDHTHIILEISLNPILIKTDNQITNYKNINWNKMKNYLELNDYEQESLQDKTLEELDEAIDKWQNKIKEAVEYAAPKNSYKIIGSAANTATIRALKAEAREIREYSSNFGWTLLTKTLMAKTRKKLVRERKKRKTKKLEEIIGEIELDQKKTQKVLE